MKAQNLLFIVLVLAAGSAFADPKSFQSWSAAAPPAHPAMYSFADVYRLTVAGAMASALLVDAPEAPVRVAAAHGQAGFEARFSVAPVPPRDKWLLVLAGLALAGWVAHRRLVHAL